jgi:glycosyltransferase involved in cell wall biosynthesis
MPTIDVIIPAYNAAKYLPVAIESVIAQTFADWRIILVDDGSTDETPEIARMFLEQLGAKLKYVRQDNKGLPAARNTAIRNSSAEFLALLDADDVWLPCRLSESLRAFGCRADVGLAYGLVSRIDQDGAIIDTPLKNQKHSDRRIVSHIYMRRLHLPCPSITFRRACIDDVGFFDETMRATEDRDLCLRIALRYAVRFVPKVLAYYRISPNSMSTDPERMLQAQLQFIEKHYGEPGCGLLAKQIALSTLYKDRAEGFSRRGNVRLALSNAMHALALNPLNIGTIRTAASLTVKRLLPFLCFRVF